MKANCPVSGRVVDFAAGELSLPDQREIEAHLHQCARCRAELASYHQLIASLRSLPVLQTSQDLTPRVLAAIHRPQRHSSLHRTLWLGSAAAVALLSFLPFIHRDRTPTPPSVAAISAYDPATSVERALDWLCTHQQPNGSWDAEKWGGSRMFEVALTALPTIAIIGKDPATPQRTAAAARAVEWLRAQQSEDGVFGPETQGMPYNHSIATLALLHAYRQQLDPYLKRSVDSAVAAMIRAQSRDGGWSWRGAATSDSTITAWHIEALRLANDLGVENSQPALDRGLAWQMAHPETQPTHIPSSTLLTQNTSLPAHSAPDLRRSYFLTTDLQREQDEDSQQQLATIRQSLIHYQVTNGADSGSWPPDDRWGRGGGRIYSTALASLALVDE